MFAAEGDLYLVHMIQVFRRTVQLGVLGVPAQPQGSCRSMTPLRPDYPLLASQVRHHADRLTN